MKVLLVLKDWKQSVKDAGTSTIRYALVVDTVDLAATTTYVVAYNTYSDFKKQYDKQLKGIEQVTGQLSPLNTYEKAHLDEYKTTLL